MQEQPMNNPAAGVQEESQDMNRWEMETEPLLDKIYHKLIGYSENSEGVWERNDLLPRFMNELGSSEFVHEIRMRFNVNMQFSDLKEEEIRRMASNSGKNFADKIQDNYESWEVNPSESNLRAICDQLVDSLLIFLRIARDGGMKLHRENRGVKKYYNAQTGGAY